MSFGPTLPAARASRQSAGPAAAQRDIQFGGMARRAQVNTKVSSRHDRCDDAESALDLNPGEVRVQRPVCTFVHTSLILAAAC